ncbi:hypothetical protein DIPPA_31224 [Diplonema papillatum]|nr:hypothetical protein DIPPA_31224 [Diplonema papillatum]
MRGQCIVPLFETSSASNAVSTPAQEPSLPSLYDFLGAELVSSPDPLSRVYDKSRLPPPPAFDRNGLPHTIIFNLQLPLCEKPSLFGQQLSGKTVNAILLFTLKPETAAAAAEGCTDPAIKLLKRFLVNLSPAEKKVTDDPFLGRCKLLVRSDTGVPSAFSKYNGKPVLVTGSGRFSKTLDGSVLEVGVNIRAWTYAARLALYSNWKKVGDYRLHVGVTIEGRCDEELPERLLGCALLSLPNMVDCAPELSELPSPVPSSPGSAHTIEDDEEEPHAPAPGATAPEPAAAAPEPTAAAPEPAATAPEPAATAPEPAATAPEPAATAPEPAATAPEPTATG